MKKILALLLAAVMTLSIFASCGANEKQAYLNALLKDTGFSGVVFVTKNGHTVCQTAKGVENSETNQPITTDTKFCIGSVSKQFAAAAILLLRQEGKLSVDEDLTRFFPDYRYAKELTIRHLLDMRSGIREFYDVEYIDGAFTELPTGELRGVITNDNTAGENRRLLEDWLLRQPLEFEPDSAFEYSNSNYFLLARIVEIVSGQSYSDFLREHIIEPLGMKHTTFIDDVDLFRHPHLAAPTVTPQTVYVGVTMGLGDMISNAHDIDRWLTSLRTHALLTGESVEMMTTDYTDEYDECGKLRLRHPSLRRRSVPLGLLLDLSDDGLHRPENGHERVRRHERRHQSQRQYSRAGLESGRRSECISKSLFFAVKRKLLNCNQKNRKKQ